MKQLNRGALLGRRWCVHPEHAGSRWLHLSSFSPLRWKPDGTILYVQPFCHGCMNRVHRTAWHRRSGDQRLRRLEYQRSRYRRGRGKESYEERVAVESFRPHWEEVMQIARARFVSEVNMDAGAAGGWGGSMVGRFDRERFLTWAGISLDEFDSVRRAMAADGDERQTLDLDVCDRILSAAGQEHVVAQLYTVKRTLSLVNAS